jgi:hypothetical protein
MVGELWVSVPQGAIQLATSRLRRSLRRIECVGYALSRIVHASASLFGWSRLVTGGQANQHETADGDENEITHQDLMNTQDRPNGTGLRGLRRSGNVCVRIEPALRPRRT